MFLLANELSLYAKAEHKLGLIMGTGAGIIHAMEENPKVTFENLESAHEFVVIFRRESDQVSDQVGDQVEP